MVLYIIRVELKVGVYMEVGGGNISAQLKIMNDPNGNKSK